MFDWVFSADIFEGPPITDILDSWEESEHVRAEIKKHPNLHVAIRQLNINQERLQQDVKFWKETVSAAKDEKETLLSGVYPDAKDPKRLFTLEVCISVEALGKRQRHLVDENDLKHTNEVPAEYLLLEMKGGFLYR
jgi:hypothetical protein